MSTTRSSVSRRRVSRRRAPDGFTTLELVTTLLCIGILTVIATGQYGQYRERMRVTRAIFDINAIESAVAHYESNNRLLPNALTDLGVDVPLDPWGNPYQYLNHQTAKGKGGFRKDKRIVPINTDYDLYSMGKDGQSVGPLTAKVSRDDIVRANDGRFVGLVSDYDP